MPSESQSQIIDAALDQVRENGLDSLSVRAVAARAHYSPAGLYRYFDSIEELRNALMHEVCRQFRGHLADRLTGLPHPIALEAARATADWVDANKEISALILECTANEFVFEFEGEERPWMAFVRSDATPEEQRRIAILGWDFLRSLVALRSESPDFDYERAFEAGGDMLKQGHQKGLI